MVRIQISNFDVPQIFDATKLSPKIYAWIPLFSVILIFILVKLFITIYNKCPAKIEEFKFCNG